MGSGLAQVGALLALTVIGLPLFFFGLMAALDRFEQRLARTPRNVAQPAPARPGSAAAVAAKPVPLPAPANSSAAQVSSEKTSPATA